MTPEEEAKKKADDQQKAETAKLVNDGVTAALAGLPSLIDQSVAKHVEKLVPKPAPKDEGDKGGGDKTDWKKIVAEMQAKDQDRDKELAKEKAKAALATAVAALPFYDPAEAVNELLPSVAFKDGKHVVPGTKTVLGVQAPHDYTLAEAAQQLAARKTHWVKTEVKGGTGAGGSEGGGASFDFSKDPSYDELMDPANGKQLAAFQDKHPDRFQRIQREALVRLQKGK